MIRGILLGSAWGLVLGGGFLAIMSLTYPATVQPPPETASEVDVTAEPKADTAPERIPSPLSQPERHDAAKVTRPDQDDLAAVGEDHDPGPAPELAAPEVSLGAGPEATPSIDLPRVAPDSAVLPSPLALAPAAPDPEATPDVSTRPAQPPRAEPGEVVTGFPTDDLTQTARAPEPVQDAAPVVTGEVPQAPAALEPDAAMATTVAEPPVVADAPAEDAAAEPVDTAAASDSATPVVEAPNADESETPPVASAEAADDATPATRAPETSPEVATATPTPDPIPEPAAPEPAAPEPEVAEAEAPAPQTPTAETVAPAEDAAPSEPATPPTVAMPGAPGIRLTEDTPAEPAAPADPAPETVTEAEPLPPIDRYAAPFENPDGQPIVSIVLLDSAADGATTDMPARFPYPVSIAVPVDAPDAADRMRRYRDAGFEVLALADLPPGATPADIETAAAAWFESVPEAVAIMERPSATLQSNRANGEQLAAILEASGHGLLLFPDGLDTTRKLAARRGVPAATVFRDLDGAGQGEAVIRRFLDHSAFKAGVEGTVILVTRLRPETLEALLVWGLADRAARVALAPVSHALKASTP